MQTLAAEILSVPAAVVFHGTVTDTCHLSRFHCKTGSLGAGYQTSPRLLQRGTKYCDDIFRFSRCGKHPAAPFCHRFQSLFLKEAQQVIVGKLLQCAEKELAISRQIGNKFFHGTGIGDVAAAFPGDHHFFSRFLHAFQYNHGGALSGSRDARHKACRLRRRLQLHQPL